MGYEAEARVCTDSQSMGYWDMSSTRRSLRFIAALAVSVGGFALACAHPAAAQQADQPTAEGGLDEIVVEARPNSPASVELVKGPQGNPSGAPTDGGATAAEPKMPTGGFEGFVEAGVGSGGRNALGGAVTVPLAGGKGLLRVEGFQTHAGGR